MSQQVKKPENKESEIVHVLPEAQTKTDQVKQPEDVKQDPKKENAIEKLQSKIIPSKLERVKSNLRPLETISETGHDKQSQATLNRLIGINFGKEQNKYNSVESRVNEKFHEIFNNNELMIDKNPDNKSSVRFDPEKLKEIPDEKLCVEDKMQVSAIRSFTEIKDMMNTKFSYKEGRLSSTLDIISQYMRGQKLLYLEAKSYCEFYLYRLMIPTIFISTACSVIGGIFADSKIAAMGVAAANGFNTLLLALINYFKLDARAEAHRMTAYSFDQLISECEFTSGKILLSNLVNDTELSKDAEKYSLKYVQDFMSKLENKVKEIKQKNQFIIPDSIRHRYPNTYYTNIFALVNQSQIQEMILTNQLKLACNAFAEIENQIIKGDRREEIYEEYNIKLKQKNKLIEDILEHRQNLLAFDQELRVEVKNNNKRCLGLRCVY
jgi:hypothetical protein